MSSKARTRAGSTKTSKRPASSSRSSSPVYDNPIIQTSTIDSESKSKSTISVEHESRLSNLESSMASIQATLNQLLALQLRATPLISPTLLASNALPATNASLLSPSNALPVDNTPSLPANNALFVSNTSSTLPVSNALPTGTVSSSATPEPAGNAAFGTISHILPSTVASASPEPTNSLASIVTPEPAGTALQATKILYSYVLSKSKSRSTSTNGPSIVTPEPAGTALQGAHSSSTSETPTVSPANASPEPAGLAQAS